MALTKISTNGVKDDAVTRAQIVNGAINGSKCENESIGAEKLTAGTIDNGDISASANIAGSKLADNSISLAKLEHGTSSNDGKFLRANNGADPTFETVTGTTINNNADNRVITGSGTANTLEGESGLTYDGSGILAIQGSGQQQLRIGSTDGSIAAIILDGNSDGDGAGGDYSLIRHNSSGELEFYARDPSGAANYIFRTGSTEKIRFQASGGISFNGDSAGANALDDYEEVSFNPIVAQGIDGGATHVIQRGWAVKIGAFVHFSLFLRFSGTGNGNHFKIGGLPFTSANSPYGAAYSSGGSVAYTNVHFNNSNPQQVFIGANTTNMEFYNANNSNTSISGAGTNKDIYVVGNYRTAT